MSLTEDALDRRLSPILVRLTALEAHLIQGTEEDGLLAKGPGVPSLQPGDADGVVRKAAGTKFQNVVVGKHRAAPAIRCRARQASAGWSRMDT